MKKVITFFSIIAMLFIANTMASAQTTADNALLDTLTISKYTYCEIVGTGNLLGTKVTIELDFGQATKFLQDTRYKGEDGKPIKFNSMVDAMNFMGKNGWEFCQAYAITTGQQNVYHFLLKKPPTRDEF